MVYKYDYLIIGAGVAGMSYALKIARANKGRVCMICKSSLDEANTSFAQGGVASVTNLKVDNFEKHIEDTIMHRHRLKNSSTGESISTKKTGTLTCTAREATLNSVFSTMPTIPVRRYSED